MAVGDIHSSARGTGARFNDGKAPYELIPIELIAGMVKEDSIGYMLSELGRFQFTHDGEIVKSLLCEFGEHLEDCARVFDYGRKKYAEWNWLKGMPWSVPLGCAVRHLLALDKGEELDPESGLHHMGHVLCNLVMLASYADVYREGNNLPRVPNHDTN